MQPLNKMNNIPQTQADKLIVAAIQMSSHQEWQVNCRTAKNYIQQAAQQGAKLVVLPEYFCMMGAGESVKIALAEEHDNGKIQQFLAEQAQLNNVWIVGGSIPVISDNVDKPYSRCYVYSDEGACVCWYDKIHLFDVQVDDATQTYFESKNCTAGSQVKCFDSPWGKVGLSICYDIRFPELYRQLVQQGVTIFVFPAAFTAKTGRAHWSVLLQARAIENQAFLIASAQTGIHSNARATWGHSCIISPWGELLAELPEKEGVVIAELDLRQQQNIRNEFPVLSHTRL